MSTNAAVIRDVLTDDPQTRHQLAEAAGIELAVVSSTLSTLKSAGEAMNTPQGWLRGGGDVRTNDSQERPRLDIPTLGVVPKPKASDPAERAKKTPAPRFYRGEQGDLIIDLGRAGAGMKRLVIEAKDVDRLRRFIGK